MDVVTLALAKKSAKKYVDEVIDGMARSLIYRGAVDYYKDLPSNADLGECYTVRYKGESGTEVSGAEYVWGKVVSSGNPEWIHLGEEIDLTNYVKNTDYATDAKGGVFKVGSNNALKISNNGFAYADTINYADYQTKGTDYFIGKGTLENVITGKGLISNTDYATGNTAGVVKNSSSRGFLTDANGLPYSLERTYEEYVSSSAISFISKGTLENVLINRLGNIDTILDNINGEVI